jgi:peptide/nickel transport system substrate-binding protein
MIRILRLAAAGSALALAAAMLVPAPAHAAKSGGLLTLTQREDLPQGFAIHETATISSVWPSMPCFNNLVLFDPLKTVESADSIIGELAAKWSWQDGYRNLVFFLRKDVKWHDGKPFTSKDVKYTFDMLREAPDASQKLRLNPRKDWYANVEAVEAADAYTVIFRLAPAAVPPDDARLRVHPGLCRSRASRHLPNRLRGYGAVQAEGVAQG